MLPGRWSEKSEFSTWHTDYGQKNRYSRDIHEIDPQCDHVISCDIDFDLQSELATRSAAGRVDVEAKLDITRSHC